MYVRMHIFSFGCFFFFFPFLSHPISAISLVNQSPLLHAERDRKNAKVKGGDIKKKKKKKKGKKDQEMAADRRKRNEEDEIKELARGVTYNVKKRVLLKLSTCFFSLSLSTLSCAFSLFLSCCSRS